jgi:DNA-binding response OmpR family regulator
MLGCLVFETEKEMERAIVTHGHILLVEDLPGNRENLTHILEKAGFRVTAPTDGETALGSIRTGKSDLILLDIDLRNWGMDGRKLLHNIRDDGDQTPVILLTAVYMSEVDEIVGFDIGADDYIRKTVSGEVLVARIRSLLRRTGAGKRPLARCPKLNTGPDRPLILGRRAKDAFLQGRALHLKRKLFELLECLMLHPDEVMSREEILDNLPASWINDPRIIDRHMAPLRKALGDDPKSPIYIETAHTEGYRFIGPVEGEE